MKKLDKRWFLFLLLIVILASGLSIATQGALMDMIPEERKIIETALETVYNGGNDRLLILLLVFERNIYYQRLIRKPHMSWKS